jgi:pyruvate/2-oxoacid:ferredoxin oxidoreductase beta subunit
VCFSGGGDLAGIGGNHLIPAARRNIDLMCVLVNNFIYGMTGGQNAPTTPLTARTSTMSFGNFERPFNLAHLAASCGATYVARWTCLDIRRLTTAFREAIQRKGFRFVEVIAPCSTLYAPYAPQQAGNAITPTRVSEPSGRSSTISTCPRWTTYMQSPTSPWRTMTSPLL